MKLHELIKNFIQDYLDKNKIDFDDWSINPSTQKGFGDYSSNVALKLTKLLKKSPFEIAEVPTGPVGCNVNPVNSFTHKAS